MNSGVAISRQPALHAGFGFASFCMANNIARGFIAEREREKAENRQPVDLARVAVAGLAVAIAWKSTTATLFCCKRLEVLIVQGKE